MYAGYREFPPPPALRGSIACLWERRGAGGSVRVLPDACTDIVWRQGAGASVAGPDTTAWFSPTGRGELIAGVRFLPGTGGAAFGVPLIELRDRRASLSELGLDPDEEHAVAGPQCALLPAMRARKEVPAVRHER
jgi:hypothetical protein